MATTPDLQEPQIAAARAQAWHQAGEPLLTLEAAREWVNQYGLVLFAPRTGNLGAPAPSLAEATLGEAKSTVTLAESDTARTLAARLVGEGSALPLNLFGGPGDLPDFLVSAQAFPFVFTMRGDKAWKRAPETSGAVKVTPLGLRIYELLVEKGSLTIEEIVSEVGREVTESAVARALGELWQILRVIPVLQQGEGATRWELLTTRFIKAVKAGANAGLPTAMSALVSSYLTQSLVATEDEIAAFLSPLTARSRIREVLHGLSAARQLAEGVLNGKTVHFVPEMLPDFAAFAPEPEDEEDETSEEGEAEATGEVAEGETEDAPPAERIRRFGQDAGKPGDRNLRGKPVRREGGERPFRSKTDRPAPGGFARRPRTGPPSGGRDAGGEGGERRPFRPRAGGDRPGQGFGSRRPAGEGGGFTRPWDEERASRPPRDREGAPSDRPFRPRTEGGDRPFRPRTEGDRPARPFRPRTEGGDRPARPYSDRGGEGRPPRRFDDRGDRPARPFRERTEGGDRPARPFRPRTEGGDRPARPFRPRTEGGDRPARPFRERSEGGDRPARPFRPRTEGGDRPQRPREGGGGFGERRGPGAGFGGRPGGAPRGDRPQGERPRFRREGEGSGEGRPRPPFGGGGRPGQGRPPRGDRPAGRPGDRPGAGGARGGFRPGPKRTGKPGARPDRPGPPRRPRPEDEA